MLNKLKSLYETLLTNNGLRATFVVIFVATMLTIYELSMFYFVVVPKVNTQINDGIIEVSKNIKEIDVINTDKLINENDYLKEIDQFLNNIRELDTENRYAFLINMFEKYKVTIIDKIKNTINENVKKITNTYSSSTNYNEHKINTLKSLFETFQDREDVLLDKINNYTIVTSFFLLSVLCIILFLIKNKLNERGENIGKCVWVLSFITLFLIMIFQYAFYVFGNKYNYLGSEGNEELLYYLLKKL